MALNQRDINVAYVAIKDIPAFKETVDWNSKYPSIDKLAEDLSFNEVATSNETYIDYLYNEYTRRTADNGGKQFWLGVLEQSNDKDATKQAFINSVASSIGSKDYQGLVASNRAWLEGVYNSYLGRSSDAGGLEFWNNVLLSGTSRKDVLESMIASVATHPGTADYEMLSNSNKAWLNGIYNNLLGRNADIDGMNFWNNAILGGMSRSQVLESVVNAILANIGDDNDIFNAKINVADAVTNAFNGFNDKVSADDKNIALIKLKNLMDSTTKETTPESIQTQIDDFVGEYQNITDNQFTISPYDELKSNDSGSSYFSGIIDITNTANGTIQNTDSAQGSTKFKDTLQINVKSDATHKTLYLNDTMPKVSNIEKLEINNNTSTIYGSLDGTNFKDSVIITGSGNVELSVSNAAYEKLAIATGGNADSFITINSELNSYKGGSGVDDIVANGTINSIETNANNDKISIKGTATIKENAYINLGSDNDTLEIQSGANIGSGVIVEAGTGSDTLVLNDADATNIKNLYNFDVISSNGGKISASAANGMNATLNATSTLNVVASKDTTTLNIENIKASILGDAYVNVLDLSRGVVVLGGDANKTVNLSPDATNVTLNKVSNKTSIIAEGITNMLKISVPLTMPNVDIERRSDAIAVLKAIYGDTLPEKADAFIISNSTKSAIWNVNKNITSTEQNISPDSIDTLMAVLDRALNTSDSVKANRIDIGGGSGESGDIVSIASYNDFEDPTNIIIGESTTKNGDLYDFDNTENSVTLTDITGAVNISAISYTDDKIINLKPTGNVSEAILNTTTAKAVLMLENNANIAADTLQNISTVVINGANTISENDIVNLKEIIATNEKGDKIALDTTKDLNLANIANPNTKEVLMNIGANANVALNPNDNIKENITPLADNILITGLDKQDSILNTDGDKQVVVNSLKSFKSGETYIVRGANVVDAKSAAEFLSDKNKVFTFLDNVKSGDSATFVFITSKSQSEQKSYIFSFTASAEAAATQENFTLKATVNDVLAKLDSITGDLMLADNAQSIDNFVPIAPSTQVYTSIDASQDGTATALDLSQKAVAAKDGIIITGDEANPNWSQKAKSIVLNGNVDNNILVEFDSVNNSTNEKGVVKTMQFAGMSITNITDNLKGDHTLLLNSIETGIGYGDNSSGAAGVEYQKATLNINSESKITIKDFGGNNNQAGNALNADSSNNTIILDSHLGNMNFNLGAGDDTLVITRPWLSLNVAPRMGGAGDDTVILSANNSNAWVAKERTPINDFTNGVETLRVVNINDKSYAYEGVSSDIVTKLDQATLKNITYFEGNVELAHRIGDDKYTSDISNVFEATTNIDLSNIQSKANKLDENIDVVAKISLNVSGEAEYGKNGVISLSDKNAEVFETVILGDANTPNAKNIIVNNLASGDMLSLSNITAFENIGAGEFVEVTYHNAIQADTATVFNWKDYTGDITKATDVANDFQKGNVTIDGEKALLAVVNFDTTKTAIYSIDDTIGTQASIIEEDELNLIAVIDLGIKAGDEVLAKGDISFS